MLGLLLPIAFFGCLSLVQGQAGTYTPFRPHSIPIAVRSPFVNVWLPSENEAGGGVLSNQWPQFWLGLDHQWCGLIQVDNNPYVWMGQMSSNTLPSAAQNSVTITATQTTFNLSAGAVNVIATFLSPIESDPVKTSLPFSYLSVSVESNDGKPHNVSVYTDVSGSWLVGAAPQQGRQASSASSRNGTVGIFSAQLVNQTDYVQASDMILQGKLLYAALEPSGGGQTFQSGQDSVVRGGFLAYGNLPNTVDTNTRALNDQPLVLAFAQALSVPASGSASCLFAVGHARDPAILFLNTPRSVYFYYKYATPEAAITDFLFDFSNASATAQALDSKIQSDAIDVAGTNYAGLLALSLRQAFGAQELTLGGNAANGWNTSDVMLFQEEIGSTGYVNTADVLYPTAPALFYVEPKMIQWIIEPLLYVQSMGLYPHVYAMHDLGLAYPLAPGYPDGNDEHMPLEECGDMIQMALLAAEGTGDNSQLQRYLPLFQQWANYLAGNGLTPALQLSTNDFQGELANRTSLAIKSIVGLSAMSEISTLLGMKDQAQNYTSIVQGWLPLFYSYANSSDGTHLTNNYGNTSSWESEYNLFFDRLLGLNVFPTSLYESQNAFYLTVNQTYGLALDSSAPDAKTDFACFTAATATTNTTRDMIINGIVNYIKNPLDTLSDPLADYYSVITGVEAAFLDRPVVGGHFSLLAMKKLNRPFLFA